MHYDPLKSLKATLVGAIPVLTVALVFGCLAGIVGLTGCCTDDRMVIELHHVELANSQAEVVRAEQAIRDFGLEVESVDFGCRNGTFINITVTGRAKRWIERYNEEHRKRLQLEAALPASPGSATQGGM